MSLAPVSYFEPLGSHPMVEATTRIPTIAITPTTAAGTRPWSLAWSGAGTSCRRVVVGPGPLEAAKPGRGCGAPEVP
jgi:hypothetical protein